MHQSKLHYSLWLIGLLCLFSTKLGAVSVSLSGSADICTVPAGVAVTYTAVSTSSVSGGTCNIHEWEVTGGSIVESGTTRVNIFSGGDIFDPEDKCRSKACLVPGVPCIPVNNAQTTTITVIWNAGVSERKVKVKAKREHGTLGTWSDTAEDKGKFSAATGISRIGGFNTCTGAVFRADLPSDVCTPTAFRWRLNGGGVQTTSTNTISYPNFNNKVSNTVQVEVVYGNVLTSSPTVRTVAATFVAGYIQGPSTICGAGAFNLLGTAITNINWTASDPAVDILFPTSANGYLELLGPISGTSFWLDVSYTQCGETRYSSLRVTVDCSGGGGGPLGPVRTDQEATISEGNQGQIEPQGVTEQQALGSTITSSSSFQNIGDQSDFFVAPFPNPVASGGVLSVVLDEADGPANLLLLNVQGQIVRSFPLEASGRIDLQLPELGTGIYFLQVQQQSATKTHRIIVE